MSRFRPLVLAPEGNLRLLPLPRCSRKPASASAFSLAAGLDLVARVIVPPAQLHSHGPAPPAHQEMDSSRSRSPSLSYAALRRNSSEVLIRGGSRMRRSARTDLCGGGQQ